MFQFVLEGKTFVVVVIVVFMSLFGDGVLFLSNLKTNIATAAAAVVVVVAVVHEKLVFE
jgi:hypothetical protein